MALADSSSSVVMASSRVEFPLIFAGPWPRACQILGLKMDLFLYSFVCLLFVVWCLLFVVCCLFVVCYLLFVVCCLFVCCLLFVVCCFLFVACCFLFACCLLFVV